MPLDRFSTLSSLSDSHAERLSKSINGRTGKIGRTTIGVKRSMLQNGKGREVPAICERYLTPLYRGLKNAGPDLVDARYRQQEIWQGKNVDMDFAFKMALDTTNMYNNEYYANQKAPTRFFCANVFRHYDPTVYNTTVSSGYVGVASTMWNETLGPDYSYVRKLPPAGTAQSSVSAGLSVDLQSPYRYPLSGQWLNSRFNMQLLENTGWNLNPMKFKYDTQPNQNPILGGSGIETPQNVQVWANAPIIQYSGAGTTTSFPSSSYPAQQSQQTSLVPSFDSNGKIIQGYPKDGYYKSQFNKGSVSYNFVNEGTNGACIDVVVVGIKKGRSSLGGKIIQKAFLDTVQSGYMNSTLGSIGAGVLDGRTLDPNAPLTDARTEFIPDCCFKNSKSTRTSIVTAADHNQINERPFKVLSRDQFIIGGGQNRSFTVKLPRMNYDAREYMLEPTTDGEYDGSVYYGIRDHTVMVMIGCSSTFAAKVEDGTSAINAVIDHNAGDVLVSCTGTYSEQPHPVYYMPAERGSWINGVLERPNYEIPSGGTYPDISTVDVSNLDQIKPGGSTATTIDASVSAVGTVSSSPANAGA